MERPKRMTTAERQNPRSLNEDRDPRPALEIVPDPKPDIATEVERLNLELLETEQTFLAAGKAALSLYKSLGERLAIAKSNPEIGGYGKWLSWLKERGIDENRSKRAIRIHAKWDELSAIAASQSVSVTELTLTEALNAIKQTKEPDDIPNLPTFESVQELFAEWGSFEKSDGGTYKYVLNRPGGTHYFRGLNEATAWHKQHCHEGNKLSAIANKLQPTEELKASPFVPRIVSLDNGASLDGELHVDTSNDTADAPNYNKPLEELTVADVLLYEAEHSETQTPKLERIQNDFYPTAQALTEELLKIVDITGQVLEPCAGDGAIAEMFTGYIANEPYPAPDFHPDYLLDATLPESWAQFDADGGCDWVVTNPPFNKASAILPLAFQHARIGVAFLLRLSYLEPCDDRADWLQQYSDSLVQLMPFSPRPRFRADTNGSDSVTCAWFVWRKDFSWSQTNIPCPFTFIKGWR